MYDIYVFFQKTCRKFFLYPHKCNNQDSSTNEILMDCACLYRLDFETMEFIEKIESVKKINIQGCIQLKGINLKNLKDLKYINIKYCYDIYDNYLEDLKKIKDIIIIIK